MIAHKYTKDYASLQTHENLNCLLGKIDYPKTSKLFALDCYSLENGSHSCENSGRALSKFVDKSLVVLSQHWTCIHSICQSVHRTQINKRGSAINHFCEIGSQRLNRLG